MDCLTAAAENSACTSLAHRLRPISNGTRTFGLKVEDQTSIIGQMQMTQQAKSRLDGALRPVELRKLVPFEPCAVSDELGWSGMEAARYIQAPASEIKVPPLTHHAVVLITRPPEELHLVYEGVQRDVPPPAGSVSLVPAGSSALWRWRGWKDSLHIYLEPELVARVAAETFDLDPVRTTVPPLDGLDLPHLRAVLLAVDSELSAGGAGGGRLAAESLANILAVHLIRQALAPRQLSHGPDGPLPRARLRAVLEYIEEHLDANPSLGQMAAVAHLSSYHFARQFKAAIGLPPHEYLIARRVERAKQLLQGGGDLSLAEVAGNAGFSDQSKLSKHFKRLVGLTPGQFRTSARIA
jgi:AraC family transcriptional regulator